MGRKRKNNTTPKVHKELEGLDLNINEFGEIVSNLDMDKINKFLTENVPDKKLINRLDDKYQQEFKSLELGPDDDDNDTNYVEEATDEEDEFKIIEEDEDLTINEEDEEDVSKK